LLDWLTAEASLGSLAVAAFVAATFVPLSSEAVLVAVLRLHPDLHWAALAVASAANTLGGTTTYLIGRFLATKKPLREIGQLERWGPAALLFAWAPFVGDALALAAGWLRLNWLAAAAFQAAGRFARYWVVAQAALAGISGG
jgi:membrane protein YqaA with SNARE-associated domain